MKNGTGRIASMLILLLATAFVCLPAAQSQRRRLPSRRTTTPVRPAPVPVPTPLPATTQPSSDPTLVSSAEDNAAQDDAQRQTTRRTTTARTRRTPVAEAEPEQEQLRRTVNQLNEKVTKLSDDLTAIKGEQRTLVDLERLGRAEQRAEGLRAQLRDVTDKEFALKERAAQIEEEIAPDAIERRAALIGSLRPADVRDQIRRSLEREKTRVQTQLEMLSNSRARLESAIATADLEVEKIKQRIEATDREQTDAGANAAGRNAPAASTNQTNPPPTEPAQTEPPNYR